MPNIYVRLHCCNDLSSVKGLLVPPPAFLRRAVSVMGIGHIVCMALMCDKNVNNVQTNWLE